MPDLGHVAVGLFARRWRPGGSALRASLILSALALLPDLDLVGRLFGVPDLSTFGHRGAAHSLAAAAFVGVLAALWASFRELPAWRVGALAGLVVASHGALDMLDRGALGVAYLWPFSPRRLFWAWRFLPGPPAGENWLSLDGAKTVALGALPFLPLFALSLKPGWSKTR